MTNISLLSDFMCNSKVCFMTFFFCPAFVSLDLLSIVHTLSFLTCAVAVVHSQEEVCQVFLDEGYVVVRAGNSAVRTQKTYNDDNSHNIAIYSNVNGYDVIVMNRPLAKVWLERTQSFQTLHVTNCLLTVLTLQDSSVRGRHAGESAGGQAGQRRT